MKYTINLRSASHVSLLQNLPISDVLLQSNLFCRSGGMGLDELGNCASTIRDMGKKCVLSWDCLVKDDELSEAISYLKPIIDSFDSIRCTDPGTGAFLMKAYPHLSIELSLEHGSLNEHAVKAWTERFKQRLSKVVFSLQMPLNVISSMSSTLQIETEILAAGPINIFYSRRALLGQESDNRPIKELTIASDDRPDQWNPVFETEKGTTVFYDKPINVFSIQDKLQKSGIDSLRIEYLYQHELKSLADSVSQLGWQQAALSYKRDKSIEAFLFNNPTHELFSRLKNKFLAEKTEKKAGFVIESVKPKYCLVNLDVPLNLPKEVKFVSPERKTIAATLDVLHDLKGNEYKYSTEPGTYLCKWHKYVVTGSLIQITGN